MNGELVLLALRFLSAATLLTFIAQSNVWMSPVMATILILGYRLGVFVTPWFQRVFKSYSGPASFAMAALGAIAWHFGHEEIAAPLTALGMAISSYLIKAKAAHTARGAAWVAVAMNAGSLAAGAVLALAVGEKSLVILGGAGVLAVCAALAFKLDETSEAHAPTTPPRSLSSARAVATWTMLGMATGILVFAVFSVLPQTLMANPLHTGALPEWYGWLVSINAAIVVVVSVPLARYTSRYDLTGGVVPLIFGLITLLMPLILPVGTFAGALIWVCLISLCESGLSALDHLAVKDRSLLVKDASFGVGAGLCMLVSRLGAGETSGMVMGLVGLAFTLIGGVMARERLALSPVR